MVGYKIQGVGHDRLPESKRRVTSKVREQLSKDGWWIESSAAMARSLGNLGLLAVIDERLLQSIFPNTDLKMLDQTGRYQRKLDDGSVIHEIIYGKPRVKEVNTNDESQRLYK